MHSMSSTNPTEYRPATVDELEGIEVRLAEVRDALHAGDLDDAAAWLSRADQYLNGILH
jgi:hypothetical protein